MIAISPKIWVLTGFGISLLSVVVNIVVLTGINERIRLVDGDLARTTAALANQAVEIDRAEEKHDHFIILNHISKQASGDQKELANDDSIDFLHSYLKKNYGAVNDIPASEMAKAENAEWTDWLKLRAKEKEADLKEEQGKTAEAAVLKKEAADIEARAEVPKSELGAKFAALEEYVDSDDVLGKDTHDIWQDIIPYMQVSNEQFVASTQKKKARVNELQETKTKLTWWGSLATYMAVSLQLFGLMLVVAKDLLGTAKGAD